MSLKTHIVLDTASTDYEGGLPESYWPMISLLVALSLKKRFLMSMAVIGGLLSGTTAFCLKPLYTDVQLLS